MIKNEAVFTFKTASYRSAYFLHAFIKTDKI